MSTLQLYDSTTVQLLVYKSLQIYNVNVGIDIVDIVNVDNVNVDKFTVNQCR